MFGDAQARWDAAIATFDDVHRSDQGSRLVALQVAGESRETIASELGVAVSQIDEWSSELMWLSLGYPTELAAVRAKSVNTQPRDERTTRAFEGIVRELYVPRFKAAGFRKQRHRWTRQREHLEQVVDVQRHWSTGDLLSFTSNIEVTVVGLEHTVGVQRWSVVSRRVGDFFDGQDRWWSIQLGRLARDSPTILDDAEVCRDEIADGIERVIRWLDDTSTVALLAQSLLQLEADPFGLPLDRRVLDRLAAL